MPFEPSIPDDRERRTGSTPTFIKAARRLADRTSTASGKGRLRGAGLRLSRQTSSRTRAVRAVVANFRDINHRRRIEEVVPRGRRGTLPHESSRAQLTFAIFTSQPGTVESRSWNAGAERILGYGEEEIHRLEHCQHHLHP